MTEQTEPLTIPAAAKLQPGELIRFLGDNSWELADKSSDHTPDDNELMNSRALVLTVDLDGNATLLIRDDADTAAAIDWLGKAVEHLRTLSATPAEDVPPLDGASGTLTP